MLVRGEDLDRFARVLCRLLGNGIRELFLNAAASRARPTAIDAASQLDAAPCKLVLDAHGTGQVEHIGGNHDSHPSMVPWHF